MNFRFLAIFGLTVAFTSLTFGSSCFPSLQSVSSIITQKVTISAAKKKTLMNDLMAFKFNVALTTAKQLHNSGKINTAEFQLINVSELLTF